MKTRTMLLGAIAAGSLAFASSPVLADTNSGSGTQDNPSTTTQDTRDDGRKKKERREFNGVRVLSWLYEVITDQN